MIFLSLLKLERFSCHDGDSVFFCHSGYLVVKNRFLLQPVSIRKFIDILT